MTDPIADLIRAVGDEGPEPSLHRATMDRHRREWPTLWAALDRVVADVRRLGRVSPWPDPPTPGTIRDLIHHTSATQCGVWSDECPDWLLADQLHRVWAKDGPEAMIVALTAVCDGPPPSLLPLAHKSKGIRRPDPMKPERGPHGRHRHLITRHRHRPLPGHRPVGDAAHWHVWWAHTHATDD